MSKVRLKAVLSFFVALIFLIITLCVPCFAEKGQNKRLKHTDRKTFFSCKTQYDVFQKMLRFRGKENKRIFVWAYNSMVRASGLKEKVKNVNVDFYEDDLLGVWAFLGSKKANKLYSDDQLSYLFDFINIVAEDSDITLE
ncbi:MAG: hypothetical protein RUMPE_00269 [Eubacteriales bacterium SKADARSKE-1]|nr:hypothetical protein [Eubacteriales bacterium SKADARSKE-1]